MSPPPATSHAARAALALSLAGRALDPNTEASRHGDTALGGALLAQALRHAALALGAAERESLAETVGSLDDATLTRVAGSRERALSLTETVFAAARGGDATDLDDAELFASKLVELATNGRRLGRAAIVWRLAQGVALAASLTAAFTVFWRAEHAPYTFTTSSALSGYAAAGTLPVTTSRDVFFHTNDEERPWLQIDLGEERAVSRVVVTNRFDCCRERATPLVIEVRGATGGFREVARNAAEFDDWDATFAATRARYVRLTVPRRTVLHLRNVEIP